MAPPKLSKLELKVMDVLWQHGAASVREILEHFPKDDRPAYTTVQTVLNRLEGKKAVKRQRKIGNALIFEPVVSEGAAQKRLIDELLGLFGGRAQPLMAHLIDSGDLTLEDIEEARKTLSALREKE